jgi:steroid 5-alpha reductase family enzyme
MLSIYANAALVILGLMIALWLISLLLKDSSIVDIFWGTGFVITAWFYFFLTPDGFVARKWLIVILTTIWGLRLSIHILLRNWGHGEDYRYQQWRQEAGSNWWWRSFFKVFLLQGALMWIISAPLLAAQSNPNPARLIWLDYLGAILWGIGFFFEAVGDWQLARFRANPDNKGKLLNSGLWYYTRHPNYFGDAAQWWGFYLIAAAAGGYWTIFSPIIMTLLLRRVSGVTMLEKSLKESKPGYKEYVETTNTFIPWFPHKSSS